MKSNGKRKRSESETKREKKKRKIDKELCFICHENNNLFRCLDYPERDIRVCCKDDKSCYREWKRKYLPICLRCNKKPGNCYTRCGKGSINNACSGLENNHPRILCKQCDIVLHRCKLCRKGVAEMVCLCDSCDYVLGKALMKNPIFRHKLIDFINESDVFDSIVNKNLYK